MPRVKPGCFRVSLQVSENWFAKWNIPSAVYVCRQTLPVLCLPRSNWSAPAVYRKSILGLDKKSILNSFCVRVWNKETKRETKKETKKQRHSMKSKRPCLQHWPKYISRTVFGSAWPYISQWLIHSAYSRMRWDGSLIAITSDGSIYWILLQQQPKLPFLFHWHYHD